MIADSASDRPSESDADTTAVNALLRAPLQARSRRTLQKILSAGVRILESDGPDGLTVGAITKGARISVGSFYARFQGKDDLLRFLGEGALAESLELWTRSPEVQSGSAGEGNAGLAKEIGRVELNSSEVETSLDALLALFLAGPGRTLALLEGVQDPSPSRRRRLEAAVTEQVSALTGVDHQRAGVRVRALVGLLQDAARRSVLGKAGEEEYGFLPEGAVLREEGLALLIGRSSEVQSGVEQGRPPRTYREVRDEAEKKETVATVEEMVPAVEKPAPKVAAVPLEIAASLSDPTPEPEPLPPEPDPFDVWG